MASSSSSTAKKYQVFISFRGDTRKNFTSILYEALCRNKIETFIDEDKLEKGDGISATLLEAIEGSMISIIVFSEKYAESRWCLDELNHILLCKETRNQVVVPVFYNVNPSDIRHQHGSYAAAFVEHEKRFKDQMEKLKTWRKSLNAAAELAGWDSSKERNDSELVKAIVKDILKKISDLVPPSDADSKGLFGTENNIQTIESLLSIGSKDEHVRVVGIWGMGGIGKTTLARVLFNKFSHQFDGSSFVENMKEEIKKHGPSDLQKKVFAELLCDKDLPVVSQSVKNRLSRTKVLLVLDDIDNIRQIECLAKDRKWFGSGSRIIATSRNSQVLRNITVDDAIYEVKELNFTDALQLFSSKAFREISPAEEDYTELAKTVVKKYAKGNPLALTVLGSYLYSRSVVEWKSEMELLERIPHQEIQDVLKISYDGLSKNLKDIFLDIACFFRGQGKEVTQNILGYNYSGVIMEIRILIDRALITVNDRNEIGMHDLIQEMGQEIVRQQSNDPGERSRLWSTEDICNVLEDDRGTSAIQGIHLRCMSPDEITDSITMGPRVFKEMRNLWFLDIDPLDQSKLLFPQDIECLPNTLRYFRWNYCPLKSFPLNFKPKNLRELAIRGKHLGQIWDSEYKDLRNLKVLDLNACESLNQILDLSCASNLEDLDLSFCSSIDTFPILPNPCNIKYLRMTHTNIDRVPPSIERLTSVTIMTLDCCYRIKSLPTSIYKLKSLTILGMEESYNLENFPKILEPMECLQQLLLDVTGIKELHPSIENLTALKTLSLQNCQNLKILPNTIYNMSCLEYVNINGCPKLESLPSLPFSIKHLDARGCKSLKRVSNPWIVFKQCPRECVVEQRFDFSDCSMLDRNNIVTEFQIRVLAGTLVSISEPPQGLKSCRIRGVGICFPANEIPEWFFPQSEGSSVTTKLDPGWYNYNFIGFGVCALISFKNNSGYVGVNLHCEARFMTEHGEIVKSKLPFRMNSTKGSDHVIIQSFDVDYNDVSDAVQVSFDFCHREKSGFGSNNVNRKVRKCGIRMLYLQEPEAFCTQYEGAESNVITNTNEAKQSAREAIEIGIASGDHQVRPNAVTEESEPIELSTDGCGH